MKLLIVDDEISSIRAVEKMMDFPAIGIDRYYTALDAEKAREILEQEEIDLLLTDIEMPKESGLQLLEWVTKEKADVSCIFMTCYAEFSYIQKAMTLGSKGYLLKPLDPDELKELLLKIIKERQEMEKLQKNSRSFEENEKKLVQDFWKDLFYENISSDPAGIEEQIRSRNLEIHTDWSYGVVLLVVRTWDEEEYDRLDRFVIHNVAGELFEMMLGDAVLWQDVMQFGERSQIAICGAGDGEKLFDLCHLFAREYTQIIRQYAPVGLIAYVGRTVSIDSIAQEMERLMMMDSLHLEDHGVVLYTEEENLHRTDPKAWERFERWQTLLDGGKIDKVRKEIRAYLDDLDVNGGLNKRQFYYFNTQYSEMLSRYGQAHKIVMSRLTEQPEDARCFENASRNLPSMKAWIDCSLDRLRQIGDENEEDTDPIQMTIRYIRDHLEETLEVTELAEKVHMNPDYLTRIFRKQMNTSIKGYILAEKMNRARELLEATDLPIAEIAYQVGYYNYTSFHRAFKKQFDESPQNYRQRSE